MRGAEREPEGLVLQCRVEGLVRGGGMSYGEEVADAVEKRRKTPWMGGKMERREEGERAAQQMEELNRGERQARRNCSA